MPNIMQKNAEELQNELSTVLFDACREMREHARTIGDTTIANKLTGAITVHLHASSPKSRACARRRMAMALAWCVEHVNAAE